MFNINKKQGISSCEWLSAFIILMRISHWPLFFMRAPLFRRALSLPRGVETGVFLLEIKKVIFPTGSFYFFPSEFLLTTCFLLSIIVLKSNEFEWPSNCSREPLKSDWLFSLSANKNASSFILTFAPLYVILFIEPYWFSPTGNCSLFRESHLLVLFLSVYNISLFKFCMKRKNTWQLLLNSIL